MTEPDYADAERRLAERTVVRIIALAENGEWTAKLARIQGESELPDGLNVNGHDRRYKDAVGLADMTDRVIYLDFRFDLLRSFVHECLHVFIRMEDHVMTESAEEGLVKHEENLIFEHLIPADATRLLAALHRMLSPRCA